MLGLGKKGSITNNAEKQETLLTISILTLAAILCKYKKIYFKFFTIYFSVRHSAFFCTSFRECNP